MNAVTLVAVVAILLVLRLVFRPWRMMRRARRLALGGPFMPFGGRSLRRRAGFALLVTGLVVAAHEWSRRRPR
jgi:hypothetical protein